MMCITFAAIAAVAKKAEFACCSPVRPGAAEKQKAAR
jgi:hypothetical protein